MSTVASTIRKWKKFGTTRTLPRGGRPAKLSNRGRRVLVSEVTKISMVTMTELQRFSDKREENLPQEQPSLQHATNQACMVEWPGSTSSSSDPCYNYTTLDEYWRDILPNYYSFYNPLLDDTLVEWSGWYRLYLNGKVAQMSEWCVSTTHCGGETGLSLNGSHPRLEDGVVTREVVGTNSWWWLWSSSSCGSYKSTSIRVKACPGDYYIYEFVKPNASIPKPMYCAVAFQNISSDPCYNYESFDRPWRANNESGESICDDSFSWNGWYRFYYFGMDIRMPETCASSYSCNAFLSLSLNGTHPQIKDGVVIREVQTGASMRGSCEYKSKPIRVKACPGNYYVYELVNPHFWCSGYCTDVSTISQSVSTTSPNIITGPITLNYDPCMNYNILNDYWRSTVNYWYQDGYIPEHDDTRVKWDGWYRLFINGSSAQMPEWCASFMACGGFSALWLGGSHPQLGDGVVTRDIYGSYYSQGSYYRSDPIQVKACPGNYYVYKFTRPPLSIPAPTYCAVLFTTPSVDPCYSYTTLDDPRRSINNSIYYGMCDYNVKWNGWYRLLIRGQNAQMPESCVNQRMCGTEEQFWLNGSHPQLEDGVVTRQVCGSTWSGCCGYISHPIQVKACPGSYYVYECHGTYCRLVNINTNNCNTNNSNRNTNSNHNTNNSNANNSNTNSNNTNSSKNTNNDANKGNNNIATSTNINNNNNTTNKNNNNNINNNDTTTINNIENNNNNNNNTKNPNDSNHIKNTSNYNNTNKNNNNIENNNDTTTNNPNDSNICKNLNNNNSSHNKNTNYTKNANYSNNYTNLNNSNHTNNTKNPNDSNNCKNLNNTKNTNNCKNLNNAKNTNNSNNTKNLNNTKNPNNSNNCKNLNNTKNTNNTKNPNNSNNCKNLNNTRNPNDSNNTKNTNNSNNTKNLNNTKNPNNSNNCKNLNNTNNTNSSTNTNNDANKGNNNIATSTNINNNNNNTTNKNNNNNINNNDTTTINNIENNNNNNNTKNPNDSNHIKNTSNYNNTNKNNNNIENNNDTTTNNPNDSNNCKNLNNNNSSHNKNTNYTKNANYSNNYTNLNNSNHTYNTKDPNDSNNCKNLNNTKNTNNCKNLNNAKNTNNSNNTKNLNNTKNPNNSNNCKNLNNTKNTKNTKNPNNSNNCKNLNNTRNPNDSNNTKNTNNSNNTKNLNNTKNPNNSNNCKNLNNNNNTKNPNNSNNCKNLNNTRNPNDSNNCKNLNHTKNTNNTKNRNNSNNCKNLNNTRNPNDSNNTKNTNNSNNTKNTNSTKNPNDSNNCKNLNNAKNTNNSNNNKNLNNTKNPNNCKNLNNTGNPNDSNNTKNTKNPNDSNNCKNLNHTQNTNNIINNKNPNDNNNCKKLNNSNHTKNTNNTKNPNNKTTPITTTTSITLTNITTGVRDLCSELNCSENEHCGMKNGVYGCLCNENTSNADSFDFSETCESSSGSMSVSRCQLFEAGFSADALHLNDPSCKGTVQNGRVEFRFDNDEHICGTNLVANGTHFIYDNFILGTSMSEHLIGKEKILTLSFSCAYPQTQTLSMNEEINPLESIVHKSLPSGEGSYRVRMIPFQDDEFMQPFNGSVDVELDQDMHVEVRVEGVDSRQFALVMDTCWATPVNDPNYNLRWDLIVQECPNPNVDTVELLQNGVSTASRFSFRLSNFTSNSTELYLHCTVHLCLLSSNQCSTNCTSGPQWRERRSLDFRDSASISMGPLMLSEGETDKWMADQVKVSKASCLCASLIVLLVPLMSILILF
ncbi:uncharacterized protein [Pseudorasbora parva]|uniref:uncharacterized protein n=1 Tax=Pseudorasbora parva TaxID=51549 RepID=UPI00351F0278